ncbi:succinylglutamate desuccinylase/aspartoacylase family protein [Gymnodinialimonas sp. 57CJ19]|uniref:succinylglutamate desuccinylase/aspartoacylase family protein n=1 Tax=Gymnodinialimonas sp. 57CJ19 TaxID=3138498 RepID=UPI0031342B97
MTAPGLIETCHPTALSQHPLRVFTLTGVSPGPVLALIGAVHGDELEGPLTLSALMQYLDPARLCGQLILCPAANAEALAASTRCSPSDGLNLARCFPGDPKGAPTEVLAALIAEHVIRPADALVDLHSGGGPVDCPVFAGYGDAPATRTANLAMARAFGAPVIWRHPAPIASGRTLSEADASGIPAIYIEAGGGTFPTEDILEAYSDGVRRVMAHLGMIDSAPLTATAPLFVAGNGDLDAAIMAPASGLCSCRVSLLDKISAGQPCFDITDIDGRLLHTIAAQADGITMFLRRSRWVSKGDLLMASATPDD